MKASLVDDRPNQFLDCLAYGRRVFEDLFCHQIKQLLTTFPLDRVTNNGQPFWSGAKKPPTPLVFDVEDPAHRLFVTSVAQLRAKVYNIPVDTSLVQNEPALKAFIISVPVAEFRAIEGLKIAASDEELKEQQSETRAPTAATAAASSLSELDRTCANLISTLPPREVLTQHENFRIASVDFDKDLDEHMVVVAAASNLRARNYRIPEADLHTSRGIAGKIIPAIATTTAMVTGAICFELMKVLQQKPVSQLHNFFANLAIPIFTSEEPQPPKSTTALIKGKEWKWTAWDHIDVKGPGLTVQGLMDWLEEEYGLELSMLSSGVTILFSVYMDPKKRNERSKMSLDTLVQTVTKKSIPIEQKYIILELMVSDVETSEDVEVPYLRYCLR